MFPLMLTSSRSRSRTQIKGNANDDAAGEQDDARNKLEEKTWSKEYTHAAKSEENRSKKTKVDRHNRSLKKRTIAEMELRLLRGLRTSTLLNT